MPDPDYSAMLEVALAEARKGLTEGGIPIGAAIFEADGKLVGAGHNRRIQNGDPSLHGETDAFRNAGRQRSYRKLIMISTLAPCWYCSGLVRQFGFGTLIVGESRNFKGGRGLVAFARRRSHRPRFRRVRLYVTRVYSPAPRNLERRYRGGVIRLLLY